MANGPNSSLRDQLRILSKSHSLNAVAASLEASLEKSGDGWELTAPHMANGEISRPATPRDEEEVEMRTLKLPDTPRTPGSAVTLVPPVEPRTPGSMITLVDDGRTDGESDGTGEESRRPSEDQGDMGIISPALLRLEWERERDSFLLPSQGQR